MINLVLLQPPDKISANPTMYQPLSLFYLAAVVEKAGYKVEIIDCREKIRHLPEAKFYGFSCTTPQVNIAKILARKVKGETIIGGPHPSLLSLDCVKHFDYVVVGEGEDIILNILEGTIRKGIVRTTRMRNLDNIPYPAWNKLPHPFSNTLFPGERYGKGELATTIIGSRGCPFDCSFCGNLHRAPVLYRSVSNIIGEVQDVIDRGVTHFRFEDDNFTLHPQFDSLCKGLQNLNIRYKAHTRSDLLTSEQAKGMFESGCEECGLGVESADDRVLRINNKKETVSEHARAVKILQNAGIRAKTYFMAGLPGETDDTLRLNKEFVGDIKPTKWTLSTFTPYPGSAVYKSPGLFGVTIVNFDWSKWGNFCKDGFNHVLNGQTQEQMWVRYKDFYAFLKEEKWR